MSRDVQKEIDTLVKNNPIFIFMKGTPDMPQCGFSAQVMQIFNAMGYPYETCDILEDEEIRQGVKDYAQWPTIPQIFIKGEFIGGCDIVTQMHLNGKLQDLLKKTFPQT